MMTRQETTESVRPPAVASLFYPGEAAELKQNLREMLDEASEAEDPNEDLPAGQHLRALIVPHAGYVYSGTTAALAYHLLRKNRDDFHRILLLGPAHRVWLEGIAFPGTDAFETPLGRIPLAKQQIRELLRFPEVQLRDDAHQDEHCLEVQLPFLQEILNEFELIPAVVGEISPDSLSGLLENLLEDPQNLLLLSTDLSHFHSYSEAQEIDQETAELASKLNAFIVPTLITYYAMERKGKDLGLPSVSIEKLNEVLVYGLNSLEICKKAAVKIGFGSDLLGPLHDQQLKEFQVRSEVLNSFEIFESATKTNAEILVMNGKLGEISEGAYADMLVLEGNPLDDVKILQEKSFKMIVQNGRIIKNEFIY